MTTRMAVPSAVLLATVFLTGCRTPDSSGVDSTPADLTPHPQVQAAAADATYRILLEDTLGATFTLPELAGHGRPQVDIKAIENGWQHVTLRWHTDLEADPRLLDYARAYGDRLLALQDPEGFFPGWLHPETHEPGPVMNQTPETSLSITFLLKLAEVTGDNQYQAAAVRAMDALLANIVPAGLWLDFETFWSCCRWGREKYPGRKIERNAMHKQNSLSILYLKYYEETGNAACFERGIAALHAGFIMMYRPENPAVKAMWNKVYPWFGPADYGFTMENYGHGGRASPEGKGMGVFTIYDWGNGASARCDSSSKCEFGKGTSSGKP